MRILVLLAAATALFTPALADETAFTKGPVLNDFGPVAAVESDVPIPGGTKMKISFDVSKPANAGELNRTLVSAARFINMHARAGVPTEDISVAVVVHGKAVHDVSRAAKYEAGIGGDNANLALIEALMAQNVRIIVCGQSAVYYDVTNEDLAPGVEMAISAMTAHVLLQQDSYALNPF